MKVSIEAHNVFKGFVDVVPEQPDLGGMHEPSVKPIEILKLPVYKLDVLKQERGSERLRRRGIRRPRGSRRSCGHPQCSSRGRRCKSDFSGLSA